MDKSLAYCLFRVCLSFSPKYDISDVTGLLEGKSAIRLHLEFVDWGTTGEHFGIRGYCVGTVGYDEKQVRKYIRKIIDKEQMELELEKTETSSRGSLQATGSVGGYD